MMPDSLIKPVLWGLVVAALLTGCAPRYRADDPSIFGRREVLDQVAK